MFKMMSKTSRLFAVGAVILWASAVSADVIIYADTFTRTGALLADVPDTRLGLYGGSASATWAGANFPLASDMVSAATVNGAATLPFVPETGRVYTLSVTENTLTGNGWLALGYSDGPGSSINSYHLDVTLAFPKAWMLMISPTSGSNNQSFYGGGTNGVANGAPIGNAKGTHTISIVLDTNPALWTLDWKIDGVSKRTAAFAANPTISSISFGREAASTGTFDDFSLTVDVPEPATLGLLGMGGLLMLPRRR